MDYYPRLFIIVDREKRGGYFGFNCSFQYASSRCSFLRFQLKLLQEYQVLKLFFLRLDYRLNWGDIKGANNWIENLYKFLIERKITFCITKTWENMSIRSIVFILLTLNCSILKGIYSDRSDRKTGLAFYIVISSVFFHIINKMSLIASTYKSTSKVKRCWIFPKHSSRFIHFNWKHFHFISIHFGQWPIKHFSRIF